MESISRLSLSAVKEYCAHRFFTAGERLFCQGDEAVGCYIIESGSVATHCFDPDIQSECQIQEYQPGEVVGAVGMIRTDDRKVSAIATEETKALFIDQKKLELLLKNRPDVYQYFIQLAANTVAGKFRELQEQVSITALKSAKSPLVDAIVERAATAQSNFLEWPEEKVDEVIKDIAAAVHSQSLPLAQKCVYDTGMGVVDHKVLKIQLGTLEVADSLVGQPGNGSVSVEAPGVESISMPIGVVFGMIPVTNPIETIVFKTLISLKARNSIIISSHRKARNVGIDTVNIIRNILSLHGAPVDLVQTPDLPANRKLTQAFMAHEKVNFILATGGPSMVASAYQSGTPAIGVGKGNAPVWICEDADVAKAANDAISSKSFDNGVVCGSENNLLVDSSVADYFVNSAIECGAALLTFEETELLLNGIFEGSSLKGEWVGQSAEMIAKFLGIQRPYEIKLLLVEVEAGNLSSPLVREKLAPILSLIRVSSSEQALFHAKTILNIEGRGHTAIIHSANKETIQAYAQAVEVSRVLVNNPGTQGCIGACNGLQLSWTLGCGTYGGGSTNDNVSYKHLQNVKRVAY